MRSTLPEDAACWLAQGRGAGCDEIAAGLSAAGLSCQIAEIMEVGSAISQFRGPNVKIFPSTSELSGASRAIKWP